MTYFGFHLRFLLPGIAVLAFWLLVEHRQSRRLPAHLARRSGLLAIVAHVILAVVWTTPWDNYLVATGVWWYDPERVTGVTLGWVPIEEYVFFVLQTLLTGAWLLWLAQRVAPGSDGTDRRPGMPPITRRLLPGGLCCAWLGALVVLLARWTPGTYLALELAWLIPPILLQVAAGIEVLWQQRRLVGLALVSTTVYLSIVDSVAIRAGVWSIDSEQSTGILLGGVLPLEELIFFSLTTTLIVFGVTLFIGMEETPAWVPNRLKAMVTRRRRKTEA